MWGYPTLPTLPATSLVGGVGVESVGNVGSFGSPRVAPCPALVELPAGRRGVPERGPDGPQAGPGAAGEGDPLQSQFALATRSLSNPASKAASLLIVSGSRASGVSA